MPESSFVFLVVVILLALVYAFANGLNDSANAIATVISTRVLTPLMAVLMGGMLNLAGAMTGTAVAKTIGKGIIEPSGVVEATVLSAILAAVIWVFLATRFGWPVSVSHSLVAGILGAGISTAGFDIVIGSGLRK